MGWFLTGKQSKNTRKSKAKTAIRRSAMQRKPWDPKRTLLGLKLMGVFLASVLLMAGWHWTQTSLEGYVGRHESQVISPDHVVLVDLPSWMNHQVRLDIQTLAAMQISPDPMNVNGLRRAYDALSQNAWVKDVQRIHRVSADKVTIQAEYRQPAAFIEQGQQCYLIDTQGVRLPGVYKTQQASQLPLTILRGVNTPPSMEGVVWPGHSVQAGLSLIAELSHEPYRNQMEAIDVSGRDTRGRIRLAILTGQGGVVYWGLPPGQEQTIEPPAATKRAWLTQLVREDGQIDAGGKRVDLYRAALFVHLPAGQEIGQKGGYTVYQ